MLVVISVAIIVLNIILGQRTRVNRSWINERGCETRVCSIHGAIVKWNDRLQGEIIAQLISIALDG